MKIWTRKELFKGYIPYDKIKHRGERFELFSLSNFDSVHLEHKKIKRMVENFRKENKIKELIGYIKAYVVVSETYKQLEKDGHTILYLNINNDGVDCFVSR